MKKTEVKIEFKIKDLIGKVKATYARVREKVKNNIKEGNLKKLNKQNIKYYSILILMIIVAIASTYANIKSYKKAKSEEYVKYTLDNDKDKDVKTNSTNIINKKDDVKVDNSNGEQKEAVTTVSKNYKVDESSIMVKANNLGSQQVMPVDGVIKRPYSMDKVIYYESLEIWKTHRGVDITSNNSMVKAVLDGKVIGIYKDNIYGYSIVIESGEYTCIYSSLESDVLVSIGSNVKKGDEIGKVGICAGEKELGAHVHFELIKNGEYVNPEVLGIK